MEIYEGKSRLAKKQNKKNPLFAQHWQSPVTSQERARFKELIYYPLQPGYRFKLKLSDLIFIRSIIFLPKLFGYSISMKHKFSSVFIM
jgi:hypothetical protein